MKKALVSLLRLAIIVGALVLLPFISKGPEAQFAHQCVTFDTLNEDCHHSCCSMPSTQLPNEIVAEASSVGIQSIQDTPYSCGTPVGGGCGAACSGTYPQAVSDSACCLVEGSACSINAQCCGTPGDTCSNGVCTSTSSGCECYDAYGNCAFDCTPASPVIFDLNGEGFRLTDATNGVVFDISGTGHPIRMGWTAAGSNNAFLVLPGADGLVQSGKQLFGNFTPQPQSTTPNGFAALAVYDDPKNGGNGDGVIDSRDAVFASLRLWIDANHDGISQPDELHALPSLRVNSISLNYKPDQRTDQYGNVFRYRAQVDPGDTTNTGRMAYDVFFVTLPPPTTKKQPA
jgi:hypothetical protein